MFKNIIRALRLPFLTASLLPFIFGSLIWRRHFNFLGFLLGLLAALATHLSANLINDYADSKSGADWQDKNFYKFFGGSKLIQTKVFSEKFYLGAATLCAIISLVSVISLAFVLKTGAVLGFYLAIIFLSWQYSARPFRFSYHRLGEFIIFLLFGPALVMGGYFIQARIFPDLKSFILSLPFGFLTTAILFTNEIPDYSDDAKARKFTWVSITGIKYAFVFYYFLILAAFVSILAAVLKGYLGPFACFSLIPALFAIKTANILHKFSDNKIELMKSSQLTITQHTAIGLILIIDMIL